MESKWGETAGEHASERPRSRNRGRPWLHGGRMSGDLRSVEAIPETPGGFSNPRLQSHQDRRVAWQDPLDSFHESPCDTASEC
jgi:hypothetical protein